MKEMKLYKVVIREDNTPELIPVSNSGTFQTPDGKLYWIIPAEVEFTQKSTPIPQEPPAIDEATTIEEKTITLLKGGVDSVVEIARRLNLTAFTVSQIIRDAGLQTPSDVLRERIKEALLDAGRIGVSSNKLGRLCSPRQRLGPVIKSMVHRGEVKRLDNGNYTITIT